VVIKPKELEVSLASQLHEIKLNELPSRREASAIYNEIRARHGLGKFKKLLSPEASITKLAKGKGRKLAALSLPHGATSGIAETCAFRTAGCYGARGENCVAASGNGSRENVFTPRLVRLILLIEAPEAFLRLMIDELDILKRKSRSRFGFRLNAYSDIRWERILPAWFWIRYRAAAFYDYTKHPAASRPADSLPENYKLTYSFNERTTPRELSTQLGIRSVAVVISTRGGKTKNGEFRPIPSEILGAPVIDGDEDDRRWVDGIGRVVALRRKGRLKAEDPFVVKV
jgi:hypothetical protein